MANIFMTSDNHFAHKNIIEYAKRPFKDVDEMDEFMVDRWNERVNYVDTVYHLGDFTLGDLKMATGYFARLNGRIIVLGNPWHHDKRWLPKKLMDVSLPYLLSKTGDAVKVTSPIVVLETSQTGLQEPVVLCHYEFVNWDRKHYNSFHFYGHSHLAFAPFGRKMNVGVDAHGFCPLDIAILVGNIEGGGW